MGAGPELELREYKLQVVLGVEHQSVVGEMAYPHLYLTTLRSGDYYLTLLLLVENVKLGPTKDKNHIHLNLFDKVGKGRLPVIIDDLSHSVPEPLLKGKSLQYLLVHFAGAAFA